jgi:hypothetical protein
MNVHAAATVRAAVAAMLGERVVLTAEDRAAIIREYWGLVERERRAAGAARIPWREWERSDQLRAAQIRAAEAGLAEGDEARTQVTERIRGRSAEP